MANPSKAIGGAAQGAAAGTAIMPGWGTAIGAGVGLLGGLFDNSDQQAQDQIAKNQSLWNGLQSPNLQWANYNPESFDPTMAQANTIQDSPEIQSAQMSALSKLADLSNTGMSDVDAAAYQNARNIGNQMENQGNAAAMQNAASRGVAGSGLEFMMREQANQDAAQRSQQAALQQASDAARQRALYNQAYMGALGQQRQQDFSNNAANANILNQFNMANTQMQNQAGMYNVGNQNQAQMYNNQGRLNTQQQNYNDQIAKINGQTGANSQAANAYAAQNAANNEAWTNGIGAIGSAYGAYGSQKKNGQGS